MEIFIERARVRKEGQYEREIQGGPGWCIVVRNGEKGKVGILI